MQILNKERGNEMKAAVYLGNEGRSHKKTDGK